MMIKDEILDIAKSTSSGQEDGKTRSWISWLVMSTSWGWEDEILILSCRVHQDEKTRRYDHGSRQVDLIRTRRWEDEIMRTVNIYDLSHLFIFSSSLVRLDENQDLVFSSFNPHQIDFTRSRILSSCLLVLMKSTWQDPISRILAVSSWGSRLDDIQYLVFSSFHPNEFDLTRSRILSSCLLVQIKSTWQEPVSRLPVFSPSSSWIDKIQDLVFLSSRPNQVELT